MAVYSADDFKALLSSAITTHDSAEIALLHIMKTYNFDPGTLEKILTEDQLNVSFPNVEYREIAPFVGLNLNRRMHDIELFPLYRSRIPTALFKLIVEDMDVMLIQYGPPMDHRNEEMRSRFLSPIFNRLVSVFGFAFRNEPESIIEGRITTKGRVAYFFKMMGYFSVLFIEVELVIGNDTERLNAVAQVIAECDACDRNNAQNGHHVPVYGILCDGAVFNFFQFDGTTEPFTLKRGLAFDHPPTAWHSFQLPDPEDSLSSRPFIDALRPICEVTFDLLLNSYVSSLKAYHECSVNKSAREGRPMKSVDKWAEAISSAVKASEGFREAETKRQSQLIDKANLILEEAMASLKRSVELIPDLDRAKFLMRSWDDKEIDKV